MSSGSRLAVGKLAQLKRAWHGTFGAFCGVLRPRPQTIDPEYFGFVVRTTAFRDRIELMAQGTNIRNLTREHLVGFSFALPPLAEQQRIARILSTIQRSRQIEAKAKSTLQALMKATLRQLLVELEQGCESTPLGDVVDILDRFRVPLSADVRANRQGPFPYYGANGLVDHIDGFLYEGEHLLLAEDGGYWGPGEQSSYVVTGKFWVNNHAHILKARCGRAHNAFLCHLLNSMDLSTYITGSTRGKLTQGVMQSIVVQLPALEDQTRAARILTAIQRADYTTHCVIDTEDAVFDQALQRLLSGEGG
jgi:type I restriction enzyme S subunit